MSHQKQCKQGDSGALSLTVMRGKIVNLGFYTQWKCFPGMKVKKDMFRHTKAERSYHQQSHTTNVKGSLSGRRKNDTRWNMDLHKKTKSTEKGS